MKAYLHQLRISSKKVNLVAKLVRGKSVSDAITLLKFTPKRSAPILAKLIASAAANAEANFKQKKDQLVVKSLIVNEGMTLKRGTPVSRGRWHPILKRASHVMVELAATAAPKVTAKTETTEEAKPEAKKPKAPTKKAAPKSEEAAA